MIKSAWLFASDWYQTNRQTGIYNILTLYMYLEKAQRKNKQLLNSITTVVFTHVCKIFDSHENGFNS